MQNQDELISVIVPVYNVELYLAECVESLLGQTYKNFEIILVDDGSTDKSGIICDEYCSQYKQIVVFHKVNGGLSDARNFGIEKAKGTLITFLDSDDYVEKEYLEVLYRDLTENDADISIVAYRRVREDGGQSFELNLGEKKVLTGESALIDLFYQNNISVSACWKLYRKELFEDTRFVVGKLFEDILTTPLLLEKAKLVCYSNEALGNYRVRANSITESKFSIGSMQMLENTLEISKRFKGDRKVFLASYAYVFSKASKLYYMLIKQTQSESYLNEKKLTWKYIKKTRWKNLFNSKTRKTNKIGALMAFLGRKSFVFAFDLKEKIKK